jgi:flagellin
MRINTNVSGLNAQAANANTNKVIGNSLEKLSTGLRINKASDDASGLAIADKLRTQATSIKQSIDNGNSAVALTQIADKAMAEQSNILDTVKAKLLQASTSTTSSEGRAAIQNDISKLLDQLDNIAAQTNYNGTTLLDGSDFTFQIGETSTNKVVLTTTEASDTSNLGSEVRGSAVIGDITEVIETYGVDGSAAETTLTFGAHTTGDYLAGDTVTINLNNLSTGVQESFSYTVTQSDIDAEAAGGVGVESAIAAGLAAQDARLANGGTSKLTFTAATAGEVYQFDTDGGSTQSLGSSLAGMKNSVSTNGLDATNAAAFADVVDAALNDLNVIRGEFGSTQNQLMSSVENMMTTHTNLKAAESVIRDVDYAVESANFNKQNIIAQAGTYAISQANAAQQNVMRLLQ